MPGSTPVLRSRHRFRPTLSQGGSSPPGPAPNAALGAEAGSDLSLDAEGQKLPNPSLSPAFGVVRAARGRPPDGLRAVSDDARYPRRQPHPPRGASGDRCARERTVMFVAPSISIAFAPSVWWRKSRSRLRTPPRRRASPATPDTTATPPRAGGYNHSRRSMPWLTGVLTSDSSLPGLIARIAHPSRSPHDRLRHVASDRRPGPGDTSASYLYRSVVPLGRRRCLPICRSKR